MNAQQILDQLTQAQTYRDLQVALKAAKAEGYEIGCKLNASKESLEEARNTLVAEISISIPVEIAPDPELEQLTTTYTEALASQGCPAEAAKPAAEVLARETVTGTPRTEEEQTLVTAAWEASQPPLTPDESEPAASIFNPVPATLQPIATVKWAWEYASRRAAADTALCRRMASGALSAASLALQVASRAVAA